MMTNEELEMDYNDIRDRCVKIWDLATDLRNRKSLTIRDRCVKIWDLATDLRNRKSLTNSKEELKINDRKKD